MENILIGVAFVVVAQAVAFQFDVQQYKAASMEEVIRTSLTPLFIFLRLVIPVLVWIGMNRLNAAGNTWFALLTVTLLVRCIQIVSLGVRYSQWPEVRDWVALVMVFASSLMTLRTK